MGRYRRGHKNRKWRGQNRKQNGDGDSSPQMTEAEWMLLEKYLLEYRSAAYEVHHSKQTKNQGGEGEKGGIDGQSRTIVVADVVIGSHKFLPLTKETCIRPYIDLPVTLGGKERRKIHALCARLDLYHSGVGGQDDRANTNDEAAVINVSNDFNSATNTTRKRRISLSIYADGLKFVPDLQYPALPFPSRTCRPWCYHSYDSANNGDPNNFYGKRVSAIETEKQQIRHFTNLPEQSLRTSDQKDQSFCDSLDFRVLDSLDLSMVPRPEDTPWMLVDSVDKLKLCADELLYGVGTTGDDSARSPKIPKIHELAFDLEMTNILDRNNPYESKSGIRTCLIQITSDVATLVIDGQSGSSKEVYKDYIIDPLAPGLWDAIPTYLGPLFSNPKIVKIGHGIGGMDTSSLHRDFGILIVNAFDTYEASTVLSKKKGGMGLALLCRHYGLPSWEHYKALKLKYQTSDWKRRPLDDGALEYGRYDIRYLVTLRKLLMRDLVKLDMIGGGYVGFGTSLEDDSNFDSASMSTSKGGAPLLYSSGSQLGGAVISTASSISDSNNIDSLAQFTDAKEDIDDAFVETENGAEDVFVNSVDSHGAPLLHSSGIDSIIYASEFPCHQHLMKAISTSQKRCLKLWTGDEEEPIMKNPSLMSMIKQAAKQKGHGKHWTDANMKLYGKLATWRRGCARQEKVHTSEVCSLDFLVHVAYKLPSNQWELRRYSYFLPMLLEDNTLPYCNELCEIVTSSDAFQCKEHPPLFESKGMGVVSYSDEDVNEEDKQNTRKGLFKLLIASAVVGVILLTVRRARRR